MISLHGREDNETWLELGLLVSYGLAVAAAAITKSNKRATNNYQEDNFEQVF